MRVRGCVLPVSESSTFPPAPPIVCTFRVPRTRPFLFRLFILIFHRNIIRRPLRRPGSHPPPPHVQERRRRRAQKSLANVQKVGVLGGWR